MDYGSVRASIAARALELALNLQKYDQEAMEDDLRSANDHFKQAGMLDLSYRVDDPEVFVQKAFRENYKIDEVVSMVPLADVLALESVAELAAFLTPPFRY